MTAFTNYKEMSNSQYPYKSQIFWIDNLQISEMTIKDISSDYLSWLNDKNHLRYSNQRFVDHTIETCTSYVNSFVGTPNILFKITSDSRMVGTSALEIDIFNKVGLLGILISPSARNTGIGGKAWSFIVHKIAKDLGLRKIKAGVAESNIAMKKIIVNSGMNLEGILKNDLVIDNKVCDLEQYCIIFA